MAKSEKRNQKGPPKVRGWLRHLPRLETPEQGTGAALNKYGVFFPYKHQFFDLVPSGLWLYNPHLCWCGSKMLNTISMGWFQGNSGEQHKNETQFYHLTTWSRHKFSQKHPLTPSISHIPCPSPGASCWTHLSRGTGRWFRFSPKSEGKGHTLLLWGMPKPWGITCLELLMGLTEHWWSSFFRRTSLSPELSHVSLHLCCTGFSTSQWGWPELQSRDVCVPPGQLIPQERPEPPGYGTLKHHPQSFWRWAQHSSGCRIPEPTWGKGKVLVVAQRSKIWFFCFQSLTKNSAFTQRSSPQLFTFPTEGVRALPALWISFAWHLFPKESQNILAAVW